MAKLTKHAEVLNQLHSMVKKQAAEAQKNISGAPGEDVKAKSVGDEHESHNKNSVGPENVAQGYSQKPSEDPSEPLAKSKTATDLGAEILDIIRKQAEAQDTVSGEPGDVTSESVGDEHESHDKNSVKPESNTQKQTQKGSTDKSKPLSSAKKASVEELASKVASYNLGREFCAALLKSAAEQQGGSELEMIKAAGRRDFDEMISKAANALEKKQRAVKKAQLEQKRQLKQAEFNGAQAFDSLVKQAQEQELIQQNQFLAAKVAEYEELIKQAQEEYQLEVQQAMAQEQQTKLAQDVASVVLNQLKNEVVSN